MIKKVSGKNGLVELFRFLCSVWVAYFHGFFPILSDNFSGVNISIDFFFMVSGLFFLKSMAKLKERRFFEGAKFIFWNKIKGFIVPLIIAAVSIICCNIIFEWDFDSFNWPLSFLWFFLAQFVYLSIFYLLLKKVKKLSHFNIVCLAIICVTMSSCLLDNETIGRIVRGPGMISVGILISQIPKITIKSITEIKSKRRTLTINLVGFILAATAFAYLAYLPEYQIWKLHVFICIVCTSLLYFATSIPVQSNFLNLLGEFSIFIYLAQCPILLHYYGGNKNSESLFIWLCIYAIMLFVINRIANKFIMRKKVAI